MCIFRYSSELYTTSVIIVLTKHWLVLHWYIFYICVKIILAKHVYIIYKFLKVGVDFFVSGKKSIKIPFAL